MLLEFSTVKFWLIKFGELSSSILLKSSYAKRSVDGHSIFLTVGTSTIDFFFYASEFLADGKISCFSIFAVVAFATLFSRDLYLISFADNGGY